MNDHSKPFHMQPMDYAAPSALEPTHRLNAEQIEFYHAQGYLSIEAVMPESEVPVICDSYDRLFDPARSSAKENL